MNLYTTDNPSWRRTEPQFYRDSWRGGILRRLDYTGKCCVCDRRTYAFEDGQNDPRGILGERAASPLSASDYDKIGPTVPLCFSCANEEPRYRIAMKVAEGVWTDRNDS